jgi:outer membrane protein OmpA-like peptidoglycan-associated protein
MNQPQPPAHGDFGPDPARFGKRSQRKSLLPSIVGATVGFVLVIAMLIFVRTSVRGAAARIGKPQSLTAAPVAIADEAEEKYCTPAFKTVLQRVLNACGLVGGENRRGCQPADVKTFASITDADFNALFSPLRERGAVILFDEGSADLDAEAKKLLEDRWLDRRGARYFFVVARASQSGSPDKNRALSHKRANSVHFYLQEQTKDPDLDKQVGLLWLGEEFAQLGPEFCEWPSSRPSGGAKIGPKCGPETINRSAFVSWVDCRL